MANSVKFTWFGLQVFFDETSTQTIIKQSEEIGQLDAVVATLLAVPTAGTGTAMATIAGAISFLGALALVTCDSAHRGVRITIFWVGVPWCTGL